MPVPYSLSAYSLGGPMWSWTPGNQMRSNPGGSGEIQGAAPMDIKTLQALMGSGSGDQTSTIPRSTPPGGEGAIVMPGGGGGMVPMGPEYGAPFVDPYGGSAEAWAATNSPGLLSQLSQAGPNQETARQAIEAGYRGWLEKAKTEDAYKKQMARQGDIKNRTVGSSSGR